MLFSGDVDRFFGINHHTGCSACKIKIRKCVEYGTFNSTSLQKRSVCICDIDKEK